MHHVSVVLTLLIHISWCMFVPSLVMLITALIVGISDPWPLTGPFIWCVLYLLVMRRFLLSLPLPLVARASLAHRWWRLCGSPAPRSCDGWL